MGAFSERSKEGATSRPSWRRSLRLTQGSVIVLQVEELLPRLACRLFVCPLPRREDVRRGTFTCHDTSCWPGISSPCSLSTRAIHDQKTALHDSCAHAECVLERDALNALSWTNAF